MSNVWERFEGIATIDEIKEARTNDWEKPEDGLRRVNLIGIEPTETMQGAPVADFTFKDLDNGKKFRHRMFLTNENYENGTAKAISAVMSFAEKFAGTELRFENMAKLSDDLSAIKTNDVFILRVETPEGKKYPKITFVKKETASDFADELPF